MPQINISIQDTRAKLMRLPEVVSISDPGKGLNAVRVTPRDLFAIRQAIKAPVY